MSTRSQNIRAQSKGLFGLAEEVMRNPRTRNVTGFAVAAVLAAIAYSIAQAPKEQIVAGKLARNTKVTILWEDPEETLIQTAAGQAWVRRDSICPDMSTGT